MSLDKAISSGKEFRRPYNKPKSVDSCCRNHGDCWCCYKNRMHSTRVRLEKSKYYMKEYKDN